MNPLSRRTFLRTTTWRRPFALSQPGARRRPQPEGRISGMLCGTAFGDALGGPIEFRIQNWSKTPASSPSLATRRSSRPGRNEKPFAARMQLRSYDPTSAHAESYGQWNSHAAPAQSPTTPAKAGFSWTPSQSRPKWDNGRSVPGKWRAFLDWPAGKAISGNPGCCPSPPIGWKSGNWRHAGFWENVILSKALPRSGWRGLPTCCGQMTSLPLAALFPDRPKAYQAAWKIGFFDNGWGKDLKCSRRRGSVNGANASLRIDPIPREAWNRIISPCEPATLYRYSGIRWTQRAVDRWLDYACEPPETRGPPRPDVQAWQSEFP